MDKDLECQNIYNIENGEEQCETGERMRAGADTCGTDAQVYVLIASIIILVIGIFQTVTNHSAFYLLLLGIAATVLAVLGMTTKNSLFYLILMILMIIAAILLIVELVFFIMNGFKVDFRSIIHILLGVLYICFTIHLAIVCNSLR
ncbi:unnamed protein product [Cylicocyclus nassatus]|uniref:Uncharacterized protein n=1 Tax=Cylicocyclus nassatus TaxID=53992 RepID=A0AA36GVC5_CYLNA|nr:unnamed protein product [Cylicocyclus nassatus]